MLWFRNLLSLILVSGTSAACPVDELSLSSRSLPETTQLVPVPPKQDPFYSAPQGYELTIPGSILRIRKAPGKLAEVFNVSLAAYNIVYRTTDSRYRPAWAVTTLLVPSEIQPGSDGSALLSYQFPYNTANIDNSPSYTIYSDDYTTALIVSDVQPILRRGYYVNIPDFEGPTASFASGVSEGYAVIDSVRAALKFTSGARSALWGYSGGSIASEWAAELAMQYAPEIQFCGAAIGGTIANVTDILSRIDGTAASWLVPALVLGLTSQYPDASEYVVSNLKKTGSTNETESLATRNYSAAQTVAAFSNHSVLNEYFENGNSTIFASPLLHRILNADGQMGYHGVPEMPLYMYKAVQDEYSAIEHADALVQRYCDVGANITYKRNLRGNHLDEFTNGNAGALAWLTQVLSDNSPRNTSFPVSCSIQNVTVGTEDHPPFYMPPL